MKGKVSIIKTQAEFDIPNKDLIIIGKFFNHLIPAFVKDEMGSLHDKYSFKRWKRTIEMYKDAYTLVEGKEELLHTLPLKFIEAFAEKAPFEEDKKLRQMWINLLANASLEGGDRNHLYTSILDELVGNDAKCLEFMYKKVNSEQSLKLWKIKFHNKELNDYLQVDPEYGKVIINNLTRLALIEVISVGFPEIDINEINDLNSMRNYLRKIDEYNKNANSRLVLTQLGYDFIRACSFPK